MAVCLLPSKWGDHVGDPRVSIHKFFLLRAKKLSHLTCVIHYPTTKMNFYQRIGVVSLLLVFAGPAANAR